MGMVVMGALLVGAFAPYSQWGQSAKKAVEIPTVSASWFEVVSATDEASDPIQTTIAAPPYIILGPVLKQNEPAYQEPSLRISIQTMSGSYSEYVASKSASDSAQPVTLTSSNDMGSFSSLRLVMAD